MENIPLSVLILAGGLWLLLLVGCVAFLLVGMRFRSAYQTEFTENIQLREQLAQKGAESEVVEVKGEEGEASAENLEKKIAELEAAVEQQQADLELAQADDPNRVSKLRLDKLNEKYQNLRLLWESTNQELIRANARIADLLGAKTALEKERAMQARQLESLAENNEINDADTMREIIINFTEESRELLTVIESLGAEKAELEQKIADMESGGKGTAGTVVGLKRKLAEAEAVIEELKEQSA